MIIIHKMYIVIYLICKYLNMPTYLIDFRMAYDCYGMAGLVWFILLRQIVWQRQALGGTVNHQGVSLCNTAPKSRQESSNHHQEIINKSSTNHQPSSTNPHQIIKLTENSKTKPMGYRNRLGFQCGLLARPEHARFIDHEPVKNCDVPWLC